MDGQTIQLPIVSLPPTHFGVAAPDWIPLRLPLSPAARAYTRLYFQSSHPNLTRENQFVCRLAQLSYE